MAGSAATTVEAYLAELPPERRAIVSTVRDLVNSHLPPGYSETMGWGMICWGVPLSRYPDTYNRQPLCYAALAAQKNAYSLHLMGVYADSKDERSLREAYEKAGKKLDMGKCCLRFKSLDGLLQDEIARLIAGTSVEDYIAHYEQVYPAARKRTGSEAVAAKSAGAKKTANPTKVASARKVASRKKVASAKKVASTKEPASAKKTTDPKKVASFTKIARKKPASGASKASGKGRSGGDA